jgi:8-oxo-dGTP pyrophosphatase MutT (NUDIX family)
MEQLCVETPHIHHITSMPNMSLSHYQQPYYQQSYYNNKPNIICCNCGGIGHVYARCNHPITSYGIICYRLTYDCYTNSISPEYLMVQRKDSLSYVEFMRGKYDLQNISYIIKLFNNMIEEERTKIINDDFDTLWSSLWSSSNGKNFMKEYIASKEKFEKLKAGYLIRSISSTDSNEVLLVNLDYIIASSHTYLTETEWGFPKGRRSFSDEDDKRCALREFREETGINLKNIRFIKDIKPFEEIFSGSNKVRYKHVYYIAKYSQGLNNNDSDVFLNPNNKHQVREIKDVKWFSYKDAQDKIRETNVERKELLKRVNSMILKSINQ